MNLLPFFAFSTLLQGYIGIRLLLDAAGSPVFQSLLAAGLLLSALLMPLGLTGSRRLRPALSVWLTWAGLLFMGLFSSLLVLTLLRDLLLLLAALASLVWPGVLPLVAWRTLSAQLVPALALAVTLLGFINARRTAGVVRVDVPIRNLPAGLHGFTLAQISDVHVGPTIRRNYLRRIVARVNSLKADLVAITGDLVDGRVIELAGHVAPLAELQSRHGTFFVTGNHEYYSGAQAWIAELRRLGLTVLINEHVVLRHDLPVLVLAGVTDFNAGHFDAGHHSDPHAALAGAPEAAVRVLLAHQPRSAPAAAAAGYHLQLSGHTHGGQFWPWNLFVPLQQPFTSGLHRLHDLWVYTSRGTGYWGPPKRFGAPSEITLLRLVLASD